MEEPKACCLCKKTFLSGKSFDLSPEEMLAIGPSASPVVHYCNACLKVAENLQSGAQLLKGVYERTLRQAGVRNATQLADAFHKRLLESATKKLQ